MFVASCEFKSTSKMLSDHFHLRRDIREALQPQYLYYQASALRPYEYNITFTDRQVEAAASQVCVNLCQMGSHMGPLEKRSRY